jgi:hypothetical protein
MSTEAIPLEQEHAARRFARAQLSISKPKFNNHIEDGHIVLADEPGFGTEIDAAKLAALKANPPTGKGRFPFLRREGAGDTWHRPRAMKCPGEKDRDGELCNA